MKQGILLEAFTSYTDDIRKFISGTNYSGTNIKTSDGKTAYITKTGIAKPYASDLDLKDANGCKSNFKTITAAWDELGVPVGSLMVSGQSCGNETAYVQSMPPKITFDWQFYIESNPDLNLTTEQQAIDHWTNTGLNQGLLPNSTILNEMASVGKVGYIDINTQLHAVPSTAYNYNGKYKTFEYANITGTSMQDCSRPVQSVKYGDQVLITYGELFGSMNAISVFEFGNKKTNFFIRPPVGSDSMQGYPLKYGDQITITMSSTNSYTTNCGWWGCKVAYVNPETMLLGFGPGGETGGTSFYVTAPMGSNYASGTEVKFGDPVAFVASMAVRTAKMEQDDILTPGQNITSLNGKYTFTYQTDGNVCLYNTSGGGLYCSMKTHTAGKLVMQADGNLVAYDYDGAPAWSTETANQGVAPYYLSVQNDRNVVLYDANNTELWSTKTSVSTTDTATPNIPQIGYMYDNNLKFGSKKQSKGKDAFAFQNLDKKDYDVTCDQSKLQQLCNADSTCTGFIHSQTDNTWQMMNSTATADQYKITPTKPSIYVKEANIDMQDKSCVTGSSQFIDSSLFSNYPKGDDFIMNGDQCNVVDRTPIEKKQKEYKQYNTSYFKRGEQLVKNYPNTHDTNQQNVHLEKELREKTQEYKKVLTEIKGHVPSVTYDQQKIDMSLFEGSNKTNAMLWGTSAIMILGIILMIRHKNNLPVEP
jgi:hypothetical protein